MKSRVFGDPQFFLSVYYLPDWAEISELGYIHDNKPGKTVHDNSSNYTLPQDKQYKLLS